MLSIIKKYLQHTPVATSIFQLSLLITIPYGVLLGVSWSWWLAAGFFAAFIYTLVGNNIAMHRYFTHSHFTVKKPVEWFFLWVGSMMGLGGPLSYAMVHIVHHKHSDTDLDPHGPIRGKRAWLVYFHRIVDVTQTSIFSRRLFELSRKYRLLHDYYVPFVLINAATLYLIDPKVFLFLWAIPAAISCWIVTFSIWRQHIGLKANNSPIANWDIIYEGHHENHHNYPTAPNTAIHPGEIDWTYQAAKLFGARFNHKERH
jgi:stearoyl-CoA desaturase (delta-9 desaturase)